MNYWSSWQQRVVWVRPAHLVFFTLLLLTGAGAAPAGDLEAYVRQADDSFAWKQVESKSTGELSAAHLEITSQTWRGHAWTHQVRVVRPSRVRNPGIAFMLITGDGDGTRSLGLLKLLAERAGAVAAVVTRVPNQPLYDGRKEDALIAYTFDQYLKSGDATWPLLLPMVKSAVRAMDAVEAWGRQEHQQQIERFVVSGASKRGWTTWLTGAVDPRVGGIAPMVIDMLNMKAQTDWAQKAYGRQSEKIHDYSELGLVEKMGTRAMTRLREMVDPYSYRQRNTMPKLILLGTNDPYWTVDALRHYYGELPSPKLVFQTPNAGHDLGGGRESGQTLAAFFQMIADGQPLPTMTWSLKGEDRAGVSVTLDRTMKSGQLWTADSATRDFRNAKWSSRPLAADAPGQEISATVASPASGYRAFFAEVTVTASTGHDYKLSTQVQVIPDDLK